MFDNADQQYNQQVAGDSAATGTMPHIDQTPFGASFAAPTASTNQPTDPPAGPTPTAPVPTDNFNPDLLSIKQNALQELTPLVGHLDQDPEEKFRTTMMMIQASDDQSLVKEAFETAKRITDDKARAQALLDVINEINYFTQPHKNHQ